MTMSEQKATLTQDQMLTRFEALKKRRDGLWQALGEELKRANDDLLSSLKMACRRKGSKARKITWNKAHEILGEDEFRSITDPVKAWSDQRYDEVEEQRESLSQEMGDLASQIDLVPHEGHWSPYQTITSYSYKTQTDSFGYAKRRAELVAMMVEASQPHLKTLVETTNYKHTGGRRSGDFTVHVNIAEHLIEVLRHKPDKMSLKDKVQAVCRMGSNPRVYWPMLPHGFERENGFDHFGRDLKQSLQ